MIETIIAVIGIFATLVDMFAIAANRKERYMSIFWTVLYIITGVIICICWTITAVYLKKEPVWVYYMLSAGYAILVFVRVLALIDIQKEQQESKYVYRMGMLIKKDEEVFDDDRPLYCASSLFLPVKSEEHNDNN